MTEYKNSTVEVTVPPGSTGADFAAAIARTLSQPETSAASVIEAWQKDTHDVNVLAAELGKQVQAVNNGDLRRAEGLLISQAHALDNIFANLARKATCQQSLAHWEAYMRMAMKAQNQCRMTLETLATIKNPPVVIAKQANINNGGQQQVNNGGSVPAHGQCSHAPETGNEQSKLLEKSDDTRLDARAPGQASGAHPRLAPLGKRKRTKDAGR